MKLNAKVKHSIISSVPGETINFFKRKDYHDFTEEYKALIKKYQKLNEQKYGIWASNQNKLVASKEDLNQFDALPS